MSPPRAHKGRTSLLTLQWLALSLLCVYCTKSEDHVPSYLPLGKVCNADYECASDNCSNGACIAALPGFVAIGEPCSGPGTCVEDATCVDGKCVAMVQACGQTGDGCENDSDCCQGTCGATGACNTDQGTGGTGGSGAGGGSGCSSSGDACDEDSNCCNGPCTSLDECP